MKNTPLYIAKRYFPLKDAKSLLINVFLFILITLLGATLGYLFFKTHEIVFKVFSPESTINSLNEISSFSKNVIIFFKFSLITLFTLLYSGFIYWVYTFFSRISIKNTLTILGILALCILLFVLLIKVDFIFNHLFLVTGIFLISFYTLGYLGKKNSLNGVNIITSIAVFAISVATCSLFIILSVFSGLETMNIQFFSNVNPDIKILPAKGKLLPNINKITTTLDDNNNIVAYAKIIEEKVYITYDGKEDFSYLKAVDQNFTKIYKLDSALVDGVYFDFKSPYQIIPTDGSARRLQMYINYEQSAKIMTPKPGEGLITSEEDAFNSVMANPIGVAIINEQYDKYVFAPLGLAHALLQLPSNSAYAIELKTNNTTSLNNFKNNLQKQLGNSVVVKTRQDLDATFLKVMNVENLIIYLIFTLVIIIASFNLAGAIIIIILDKKKQIQSMWSFGMNLQSIKRIFFYTGLMITLFSLLFGLSLGSILGILQQKYQLVMANPFVAFPFEFSIKNLVIVIVTVLGIGTFVSYLVSRRLPK